MVISLTSQNKLNLHQINVKSTFLNGVLEEEVYVEQSTSYVKKGKEN